MLYWYTSTNTDALHPNLAYRRGLADLLSAAGHLHEAASEFELAHKLAGGGGVTGEGAVSVSPADAAAVLSGLGDVLRRQGYEYFTRFTQYKSINTDS